MPDREIENKGTVIKHTMRKYFLYRDTQKKQSVYPCIF